MRYNNNIYYENIYRGHALTLKIYTETELNSILPHPPQNIPYLGKFFDQSQTPPHSKSNLIHADLHDFIAKTIAEKVINNHSSLYKRPAAKHPREKIISANP